MKRIVTVERPLDTPDTEDDSESDAEHPELVKAEGAWNRLTSLSALKHGVTVHEKKCNREKPSWKLPSTVLFPTRSPPMT